MGIARSTPDAVSRIPLVISPENRDNTTSKDARLVNCFMETVRHPDSKNVETFIYKRPGTTISSTVVGGGAAGLGVYNWQGDIYSIFGAGFFKNGIIQGDVDAFNGVYRFNSNLGVTPHLQLGNGVAAYNFDSVGGLVQIPPSGTVITAGSFIIGTTYIISTVGTTNFTLIGAASNTVGVSFKATGVGSGTGTAAVSGFPGSFVKGWAYLDQTTYVMTNLFSGASGPIIQGSDLNDASLWDPLNNIGPTIEPDFGVALGKQLVNVIAMKQWTTEVMYDAGNATGSPLGRVAGAKANWGCLSADSVQDIDGILIWLATTRIGSTAVVAMENLRVRTVSTRAVERLLDGINTSVIYSFQLQVAQHKFYVLTFKNANLTLVYDLAENMWSQWTDPNGNYFPFVASALDTNFNHLLQHESDGNLYFGANRAFTSDGGQLIPVDIYTPNFDAGVRRRKYLSSLEVIGDQTPGSSMQVRFSDDDYQTWSQFRTVNLALRRPFLVDCGTFYSRAHHLRHRANTTFRINALEAQVSLGSL